MNTNSRENFLNKFTHQATKKFAEKLYDLELQINTHDAKKRVLEVIDFDDVVDEAELKEYETLWEHINKAPTRGFYFIYALAFYSLFCISIL